MSNKTAALVNFFLMLCLDVYKKQVYFSSVNLEKIVSGYSLLFYLLKNKCDGSLRIGFDQSSLCFQGKSFLSHSLFKGGKANSKIWLSDCMQLYSAGLAFCQCGGT